jgi:hypothetical protein
MSRIAYATSRRQLRSAYRGYEIETKPDLEMTENLFLKFRKKNQKPEALGTLYYKDGLNVLNGHIYRAAAAVSIQVRATRIYSWNCVRR